MFNFRLAEELYVKGMNMLNKTRPNKQEAYLLIQQAADHGHLKAKAQIGWAKVFGSTLRQDLPGALEIFEELVRYGLPDAHTVSNFYFKN